MHVHDWLTASTKQLTAHGITTARLDCLVLLEDATYKDRSWLLSHPECELQGSKILELNTKITQRAQHIPLAYIRGKIEFYGRDFMVNKNVLVPRPESEIIVEIVKTLTISSLCDIGTGSGALGLTAALEIPNCAVTLLDIDEAALAVAKQNANTHGITANFMHNDLLDGISDSFDVLLCNLPYVPNTYEINQAATYEPVIALFGGTDGLDLYRRLFIQSTAMPHPPRYLLCESLPHQHHNLATIARSNDYLLEKTDDFIQLFSYCG